MKSPTRLQPESLFLLNALLIAWWTIVSVRNDILGDPEFGFLLILMWPVTLFALLSVFVTSITAIVSTFYSSNTPPF